MACAKPSWVTPSGDVSACAGRWFLNTASMNSGSGMFTSAGKTSPFLSADPKLKTGARHAFAAGHGWNRDPFGTLLTQGGAR